jgi:NADPH:quinone reductase-like Zn-dependent oxidoreductase
MRAFIVRKRGTINDIEQVEIDYPAIGSDDVLVRVKAAAINPADIKVVTGKDGGRFIHSGKSPIGLGYDFSGVIQEAGPAVSGFGPGDEVFGFLPYSRKTTQGSFADYIAVDAGTIAAKPSSISHTEAAAAATTASTAWQSLVNIGGIQPGQKVLVNGASGGVGSYAVQIAKRYGAEVWGTARASNLDFLTSIGSDHALDYRHHPLRDLPIKFDIILDAVSNSYFGDCSGIMTARGVYITLLPSLGLIAGKLRSLFSARKCAACIVQPRTTNLAEIARMLNDRTISANVAAEFPIAELKTALEKYMAGGVRGKIGIVIAETDPTSNLI